MSSERLAAVAAAAQAMREDRAEYRASLLEFRRALRAAHVAGHSYSQIVPHAGINKSAVGQAIKWVERNDNSREV